MAIDVVAFITQLIEQYGLAAIFVFLVLDAAMLLPVVPGEILLIYAAQKYGSSPAGIVMVTLVGTVAATLGSFLLYGIARVGGRRFFLDHPRLFMMSPKTAEKLERTFQKRTGQALVFLLRIFPFTRLLVNIPAGLAKMSAKKFLVYTFLGMLAFHALFLWIAFEFRREGSAVSTFASTVQTGYANPAMRYAENNWLIVAAIAVGIALLFSLKASLKALRNPHEAWEGSFLGTLAVVTLFWGGLGLVVGLWIDEVLVYKTIRLSGYDLQQLRFGLPYDPLTTSYVVGIAAMLLAQVVQSVRNAARRHHKHAQKTARVRPTRKGDRAPPPTWSGAVVATDRPSSPQRAADTRHAPKPGAARSAAHRPKD